MAWAPLAVIYSGLVVTFTVGLWNIGVEGQVVAGAIAATFVARVWPDAPGWALVSAALIAGFVGGTVWGELAGALRAGGGVDEIFAGLGLDFVATGLATFLIIGPWKRAGIASTSGTNPITEHAWLPTILGTRLSLVGIALAVVVLAAVAWALARTRWGLELRAVGANPASARLLGIVPGRKILEAFAVGGGLAGVGGALLVTGFQHKLVPAISGGRGFLGILIVLLASYRIRWVAPLAIFFAMISVGQSQLQLRLDLPTALGGVLQGAVVLVAMLVTGWSAMRARRA